MRKFRNGMAYLAASVLIVTGRRFSKDYRHGVTRRHRIVHRLVNTVSANGLADRVCMSEA